MSKRTSRTRQPERQAETLRVSGTVEKIHAHLDAPSALALDYCRAWTRAHGDGRLPAPSVLIRLALIRLARDMDAQPRSGAQPASGAHLMARQVIGQAAGGYRGEDLLAAGRARLAEGVESFEEVLHSRQELRDRAALLAAVEARMVELEALQ